MQRFRINFAIVFLSSLLCAGALAASLGSLLDRADRPTVAQVKTLNTADQKALLERNIEQDVDGLAKLFRAVAPRVLRESEGRKIFLLGRDGELLHDAIIAAAGTGPKGKWLRENVVLINLSRPITINSSGKQLEAYLRAHGLDIDVAKGKIPEVMFFDTGNRGTIFVNLFKKLTELAGDDATAQKQLGEQILDRMRVSLLTSEVDKGNRRETIKAIRKAVSTDNIAAAIGDMYFDELSIPKAELQAAGVPVDKYQKWRWVVDNMEYVPHWTGRANSLNKSGSEVAAYESGASKKDSLAVQARIAESFSSGKNQEAVLKSIPPKRAPVKPVAVVKEEVAEAIPIAEAFDYELEAGDVVKSKKLGDLEIKKFVDEGRRGRVYLVEDKKGTKYALKIAVDHDADTLKSIGDEMKKEKNWKRLKLPYAAIKESGSDFVVKEFISGKRADEWLKEWKAAGGGLDVNEAKELRKFLEGISKQGEYLGDLNPKNLIWDGKRWVVIDSGSSRDDLSPEESLARLKEKMTSRWGKVTDCRSLFERLSLKK